MTTAVDVECSVCRSGTLAELIEYRSLRRVTSDCRPWPSGGRIGVCRICGAVQKPADDEFLAESNQIYSSYTIYRQAAGVEQAVFEQSSGMPESRSIRLLETFRKQVNLKATGLMLDVGCGNGATLRAFGNVAPGWKKAGTEFDAKYKAEVESIPNTGPLHIGSLENVPHTFDVITMIHVLEHIVDPVATLKSLRKKLAPGGLLLIEVPHHPANPFELLIADHRTHFTADALTRSLAAAEFEIVSVADDWIPRELSIVARSALRNTAALPPVDASAARTRVAGGIAWLRQTAGMLRALGSTGEVGLFGTSIAGTWLAAEAADQVAFFVDEDPARIGRTYLGRPVYSATHLPEGSRVFVGLPTAVAAGVCVRLARPGVEFIPPG